MSMSELHYEKQHVSEKFQGIKASRFSQELYSPKQNHFLAVLPVNDYVRLLPHMELVSMSVGEVIQEAGMQIDWVYFPITSVVCLGYITENGASPAVGLVGNDGFVGVAYAMGSDSSSTRAVVQSAGLGYRIRASLLKKELQRNGEVLRMALLYSQAFITQVSQTAVCNRLHSVDQQLCRWLLMSMDRLTSNDIHLTHELIANMLGVRREGVTQAAGKLQAKGFIQYSRGKIRILDRAGIEAEVCECYNVVNKEYQRLLPRKPEIPQALPQTRKIAASAARVTSITARTQDAPATVKAGSSTLVAEELISRDNSRSSDRRYARLS